MDILILGGTGAIGNDLAKKLEGTNNRVYITSRTKRTQHKNIEYIEGNAHDIVFLTELLSGRFYDAIVDFMAYKTEEFKDRADILLNGTNQYFFLSSSRVYAESESPICEDSLRLLDTCDDEEYLETDEYALAKARQEDILQKSSKKNWTIIRPYKTYSDYRLQFGFYEKENWLYRAMLGKKVVFPKDMAERETTLTYGADVASGIIELLGNANALGEIFHITTSQNIKWKEVFAIYSETLFELTGVKSSLELVDNDDIFYSVWNKYQIKYDCMYDRVFDNAKIQVITGSKINYLDVKEGLKQSLGEFIQKPQWRSINWDVQFWMDDITSEHIHIREIKGFREKMRFLKYKLRYGKRKNK